MKIVEIEKIIFKLENSLNINFILKNEIKKCNSALITSSSENHLKIIKKTCPIIKYYIVEKPIVQSPAQYKQLINLKKKFNFKFKEVSQNMYYHKIRFIKKPR